MKTWDDPGKAMGDDFFDSAKETFTHDGKTICPPICSTVVAIIYNKKMLRKTTGTRRG
jgi:maltose-binding protein MalE